MRQNVTSCSTFSEPLVSIQAPTHAVTTTWASRPAALARQIHARKINKANWRLRNTAPAFNGLGPDSHHSATSAKWRSDENSQELFLSQVECVLITPPLRHHQLRRIKVERHDAPSSHTNGSGPLKDGFWALDYSGESVAHQARPHAHQTD
jgi:hypothetical protein